MRVTFHRPKRPLEKLPRLSHLLFTIRLQMSRPCLQIVGGAADAAGE
jgi:hypothetical protein